MPPIGCIIGIPIIMLDDDELVVVVVDVDEEDIMPIGCIIGIGGYIIPMPPIIGWGIAGIGIPPMGIIPMPPPIIGFCCI